VNTSILGELANFPNELANFPDELANIIGK
jgi:hypothetical protein